MTTTNRLFSLFAAMIFAAIMMADVVYEPLIVSEGFNRDAIAESTSVLGSTDSPIYDNQGSKSCFATKSVIEAVNTGNSKIKNETDLAITIRSGWPNDYRDTIRCTEDGDAKDNPLYKDVVFMLAPYNQNNVLALRPDNSIGGEGTLKFKKVGCYNKMFFLTASLKQNNPSGARKVSAIVYYTDGTTTKDTFCLAEGFGGQDEHKVCMTNIYEGYFDKNTSNYAVGRGKGFASVFDIDLDETKLVDRVDFKNEVSSSAAIIFAVTGRTADIDAPDEESTTVSGLGENSFEACWDVIADAASYRIDVAEDPDFQHILADYNNLVVSGTTCQEVAGLIADNDYYWRVRSVNSDGGQSASSVPMRVKTAGGTPPETSETSENIEEMLQGYAGYRAVVPSIMIHRTLCRNGYFNTLCLPFSMNAEQIAASPLVGARVFEYVEATKTNAGLDIEINGPIDHIVAGVPYLVNWEPTTPEWIGEDGLIFENVNITTYKGDTIGADDQVQFIGNIGIANLVELNQNNLFLGANNTLYYPEGDNRLRGFRAYFNIPTDGPNAAPGAPARLVMRPQIPTDVESVEVADTRNHKVLQNGQLIIIHNGVIYNAQGQVVRSK